MQQNSTIVKQIGQPISSTSAVLINNPSQNTMHSVAGSSVKSIINLNQQQPQLHHAQTAQNQQIITPQQTNLNLNNNQQIQHQQLKLQLQSQIQQQQQIRPAIGQFQQK